MPCHYISYSIRGLYIRIFCYWAGRKQTKFNYKYISYKLQIAFYHLFPPDRTASSKAYPASLHPNPPPLNAVYLFPPKPPSVISCLSRRFTPLHHHRGVALGQGRSPYQNNSPSPNRLIYEGCDSTSLERGTKGRGKNGLMYK